MTIDVLWFWLYFGLCPFWSLADYQYVVYMAVLSECVYIPIFERVWESNRKAGEWYRKRAKFPLLEECSEHVLQGGGVDERGRKSAGKDR